MIRKFDLQTDFQLLQQGEFEAYKNSYPGTPVPTNLVPGRVRSIEENRSSCLVLDDGGAKGYVIALQRRQSNHVDTYIESIFVMPEHRGQGAARALIDALIVPGYKNTISLDVSLSNADAVKAYETMGFSIRRVHMVREHDG